MGRADLIGNGKHHLIPTFQPLTDGGYQSARRKNSTVAPGARNAAAAPQPQRGRVLTQHTGLPPRAGSVPAGRKGGPVASPKSKAQGRRG